jgi:site-specific recombinase XerD
MQSILDAPDPACRVGIRDRAMLHLCFAAGLRVSELIGIRVVDVKLQPEPSVLIHGKGRRERCIPLWKETASAVRAWLSVRGEVLAPELFVNARDGCMTRAGFEYILRKQVCIAEKRCPSLASKRVSPHVLRHYLPRDIAVTRTRPISCGQAGTQHMSSGVSGMRRSRPP